ncbi:hypothetical protein [Leptospira saintgironsiae]|nr:hypothetical protein [Leptospira saintgironsiae]
MTKHKKESINSLIPEILFFTLRQYTTPKIHSSTAIKKERVRNWRYMK